MSTEKGTPKLVEIVLPAGNEKVRVREIPELLATALYPEIPEDTPRQVIELAKARQNLAATIARAGRPSEALPFFRQAASLAPNNPAVQMGLAQ